MGACPESLEGMCPPHTKTYLGGPNLGQALRGRGLEVGNPGSVLSRTIYREAIALRFLILATVASMRLKVYFHSGQA